MRLNLKIVGLADITPLMESRAEKVEYIEEIIEDSGSIRNPFSLASVSKDEYLLLDDAALLEAVRGLEITSIPAQVVPLGKSLKITAGILAEGMKISCVDEFLRIFPRSYDVADGNNSGSRASSTIVAIHRGDSDSRVIYFKKGLSNLISPTFFDFFRHLKGCCNLTEKVYPAMTGSTNLKMTADNCLLTVSNITVDDLLFASRQGYLFPSGFLKFESGRRIMGIDYPVSVLNEQVSTRDKEQFFYDLMNIRLSSGYSEFIKSGVYLLNY